jgi:hypothetical protein
LESLNNHHHRICVEEREFLGDLVELDRSKAWVNDGHRSLPEWITAHYGISNWRARRWIEAGYALESLPSLAAALISGELCLDKIAELARFITPATEQDLVRWAKTVKIAAIRRRADLEASRESKHSSEHFLRNWRSIDGRNMHIETCVAVERGEVIMRSLDRRAAKIPDMPQEEGQLPLDGESCLEQRRADALYLMASSDVANDPDQDRASLVLHATLEQLAADKGNIELEGGALIDVETARRLTCDSRIQVITTGPNGDIGVGHWQHIAPRWLRRLVLRRDHHTCTFPGCEMKAHLTTHHVAHWARDKGPTMRLNLVTVCPFHHRLIHEQRWSVILDASERAVFFRPSGRIYDPTMAVDDVDRELAELLEKERHREPDPDSLEARFGVKNYQLQEAAHSTTEQLYELAHSLAGD